MNKIPVYEGMHGNTRIPNVFDEVVALDLKYAKYAQCTDPAYTGIACTASDKDINSITNAYAKIIGADSAIYSNYNDWLDKNKKKANSQSMKEYQAYLSTVGDLNQALNIKTMSTDQYKKNLKDIQEKHNEIVKLRRELDTKNAELNQINNPVFTDNQIKYDASVYSGVLWTILASSLLYYLFNKL